MNSNPSSSQADNGALHAQVSAAIHAHRRKIHALTATAFALGFLAVAASIAIVILNEMYVTPKQQKLAKDSRSLAWPAGSDPGANPSTDNIQARILSLEIDMMRVVSISSMIVAGSVALLGLGTLVLVTAVMLNRRATLNQINANLAQISAQLRDWRAG